MLYPRFKYASAVDVLRQRAGEDRNLDPQGPTPAIEATLRSRIARLLGQPADRLRRDVPLTAFGLDSLAAAELQGILESELGIACEMTDLLAGVTLAELAEIAGSAPGRTSQGLGAATAQTAPEEEGVFPLSHGQRALWFLDRLEPGNPAYIIAAAARVWPGLDPVALRRAFDLLATRHQALRLRFKETPAGPVQIAAPGPAVEWLEEDARGWDAGRLAERLAASAAQPFDLVQGPLLRIAVLRTGEAEHTVLLAVHHIVADLWSLAVLVRELADLYPRLCAGEAPLSAPAPRFTDHVQRLEEGLSGAAGDALFTYWRERLETAPAALELPTDRPRPPVQSFRGAALNRRLPPAALEQAGALAREKGATLFAVLLAAYGSLLSRTTGQEHLLVGSPLSGRGPAELSELVGYLVNPVALDLHLAGRPTFSDLVAQARATALAAFRHQEMPFPLLVERLHPERDPSRSPLFQAMLVLEQAHLHELGDLGAFALGEEGAHLALGSLNLESCRLEQRHAQFDLELMAAPAGGGLALRLIYDVALFDGTTVGRFLDSLAVFLTAGLDDPDRTVDELPWLSAGARQQLTAEWNDTATPLPLERGFDALFAEQARRTPEATAIAGRDRVLTYGELERAAGRLASGLLAAGLKREEPVALLAERGPEFLAALLAIWRAGGAYLPLDPRQPIPRLARMVEQSGVRRILAALPLLEIAEAAGARALALDRLLNHREPGELPPSPLPEQLAYVLFTSGSTGAPKGAMVEHRGMLNHLFAKVWDLGLGPADRVAQTAAPTFDISVWQFLAALLVGGKIEVLPDEVAADPPRLVAEAERRGVTVIETVPSILASLLAEPADGAEAPRCAALRWWIPTGEALPPEICRAWCERFPAVPLLNAYGPTECSDDVAHHPLHAALPAGALTVSIGRPVVNTHLHLLDRALSLVPLGAAGEVSVAGEGVGRGYIGDPARTAAVFVPDPHATAPGGRLYRTGDRGRRLPDGTLEFLGRLDDQVKIRGFRIEPGEIEAALAELPGVERAVVVARPDPRGEARLIAYWTAGPDSPSSTKLRELLRQRLPEAMVPTAFVRLERFPLSPHGKIDRAALLPPDWPGSDPAVRPAGAPRDAIEELLAGFFAEVLGRDAVGVDDDFFDLGGHSLLITQVASRVRRALGVDLPLAQLFATPTVAGLAARVREARPALAPPVPLPRSGELLLSSGQQRLWLLARLEPESAAYNMPGEVRLTGCLTPAALAAALAATVRRHEVLRTMFREESGVPRQGILEDAAVTLSLVDLAGIAEPTRTVLARRLAADEAARPFDLSRGPLLRTTLLRLAPDDHLLLVTLHHIAGDGWSQGILVSELSAGYAAFARGTLPALPPLPLQYADFARWQRSALLGEAMAEELRYWRARLDPLPAPLDLPLDRPRPPRQSHRGARRQARIDDATTATLRHFVRASGATLFMGLFAGFSALLARLSGQAEAALGTPLANRRWPELEELIGFFVNTLVLRVRLDPATSFSELLVRAREEALGAYAHQDLPFERLVEELEPVRDLSRSPLFQAMLALQNAPVGRLALPGLTLAFAERGNGTAKLDLTLALEEEDGELRGYLEYATDLFDGVTAERITRRLEALLRAALSAPHRPLAELPLLAPAEVQALQEWNDTATSPPPELCLHGWIERQAERTPDALAFAAPDGWMSYGELEVRANRLARTLRRRGIGPEVPVAVLLDRSLALPLALLAILKAGGAYLPLDPAYPPERLAWMIEDGLPKGGPAVLLTEERWAGLLPATSDFQPLLLDAGWAGVAQEPATRLDPTFGPLPDNLAYVIFTSGSTGRPKGAMNTHRAIVNRLLWMQEAYGLTAEDRVLQKTPYSFDVSVWELFWPLMTGARLVLAQPGGHQDGIYLARALAAFGITTVHFVPAMLQAFLEAPGVDRCIALRRVLASGEALAAPLVRQLHDLLPAVEVHNLYGPTEAAVDVTAWPCVRGEDRQTVPIGRPVSNTRIHLLDGSLHSLPPGVRGELYIGGIQVGRGYRGRPDLTAERFVPDPEATAVGARLYRTGDLARHRHDGALEFLGRVDSQVKVRGLRIELGEIEAALCRQEGVREAVVLAPEDRAGERRLVAWVTGDGLTEEALHNGLSRHLPGFMVPAAFVFLPALPLTPSGKLDRRALPAPEWRSTEEYVAPRDPREALVAGIWADLLGLPRAGVRDGFFALGGHSLLATRAISRVNEALGTDLPLRALFEHPTPEDLARAAASGLRSGRPQPPPLRRLPRGGPLPASFAQERLWVMDQLIPGNPVYNVFQAIRLSGPLDLAALEAGFAAVVDRHETLRTRFTTVQGRPYQVVEPAPGHVAWPWVDLTGLPAGAREREAVHLTRQEARRTFELRKGPLFRLALLLLDGTTRLLLVAMHHIVCDDWSIGLLVDQVAARYRTAVARRPSPLPELPFQYADFAQWQREWLAGAVFEEELAHWRSRLAGELPVLALPTDRPRPPVQSFAGTVERFNLPAPLLESLRDLGLREGTTLFMILLAAFAAVLHRASGQEDLVLGSPVAGRNRRETEELIGCFVNILPLRIDLARRPSYRELLRRVRAVALDAYDHQDLPFERLVEALQPRRDLSRPALRQAALSVQEVSRKPIELGPGITARAQEVEAGVSRLDLTLFAWAGEEGLSGFCEYSTALFDRPTIARLLEHLRITLEDMTKGMERELLVLPVAAPTSFLAGTPVSPVEGEEGEEAELTEAQLLFWFARKLQPDVELYFERATATFDLSGEIDPLHFERAFAALVDLCDALRIRVVEVDGIPRRRFDAVPGLPLEVFDFSLAEDAESAYAIWLAERSAEPMNLGQRLYDTALARLSAGRWVWFLSLHHMIADGWSLALLAGRLSHLYALSLAGRLGEARLFPSFAQYAREERAGRTTERYRRAETYWQEKLARPAAANLFYGRASAETTLETARLSVELDAGQSAEIAAAVAARGAFSPSVLFASALFALLYRTSGTRRLRLGTPFANRPDRDREVVGLLMNACPLEVEVETGETFASFARKLQREIVAASRHQHYPVRHPAGGRAYDIYLNFQSISFPTLCGLPVRFDLLCSNRSLDRLHLQVSDFAGGGRFRLDFDFNCAAFSPDERARTLGHYLTLLAAATTTPEVRFSEAPLLSAAERREILAGWNDTVRPYPDGLTLDRLLAMQSAASPGEIAVAAQEGTLTYRDLDRRSNQLAAYLRARGVGPDVLVGVAMERSLDMMVALVGVLKAGGAYVPLDPSYPADRLAGMVADARPRLLLTQAPLAAALRGLGPPLLLLDSEWEAVARCPAEPLPPLAQPASLAYMIFTSGSTGRPKGAMLAHAGIVNRLLWMQDAFHLTRDDRVLQKTPTSFDVSVWELFWPLIVGARLVMARPGGHQDPTYLVSVIAREKITTVHFVPSLLQVLLEQPGLDACACLARVVASGEALPPALCRRFHERLKADLHNLYGPTEASVDVTAWRSSPEAVRATPAIVPIGPPIANTAIYLLDRDGIPVPAGLPGELLIGGVSLARGYFGRPELTAERFVPDPFSGNAGARLYRTGDLARHLPGGEIEFLGRLDHQVKLRGIRIELGEIESAIASFPGVREAVVLLREDRPGDHRLAAYVVPEPGWGPTAAQLRGYLRTKLPEAMVPVAYVLLATLPLTPSGKVDRRALPAPEAEPAPAADSAPRTPLEALIAGVCAEVLGRESVGIFDNFFDLGGNSLLATQVVTLLEEVLPIELDLRRVFEGPTVARLAEVIAEEEKTLGEQERAVMAEIIADFKQAMEN